MLSRRGRIKQKRSFLLPTSRSHTNLNGNLIGLLMTDPEPRIGIIMVGSFVRSASILTSETGVYQASYLTCVIFASACGLRVLADRLFAEIEVTEYNILLLPAQAPSPHLASATGSSIGQDLYAIRIVPERKTKKKPPGFQSNVFSLRQFKIRSTL